MKVKIGNTWYDADHQPLGVQFSDAELACLNQMTPGDGGSNSFAAGRVEGPTEFGVDPLVKWLREGRDEPVAEPKPLAWGWPKTVGQLIAQLSTLDPGMHPISILPVPNVGGEKLKYRVLGLSMSYERYEGQWLDNKNGSQQALAFWCRQYREDVVSEAAAYEMCGCAVCDSPETCKVTPETKAKMRAGLLEWVASWTTLHWQVQVLYVVDGYETTLERDGNIVYGPFKGETYESSLYAAQAFTGGVGALEYKS